MSIQKVCLFVGSREGKHAEYMDSARALGTALAQRKCELVYGGARIGLMGAAADAVLALGGKVHGVIPKVLVANEVAHGGLTSLKIVDSMHVRKTMMHELSDAFVTLSGGVGTLDELFEAVTWSQIDLHRKPIGLLNVRGFYDHLLRFTEHAIEEGFIPPDFRERVIVEDDVERLVDRLLTQAP